MDHLRTLLVANRGEIAVRLIKTAKRLGIYTVAIYTEPDSASLHVAEADDACLLEGDATKAYGDGDQIIAISKATGAQGVIPGYGFLSENAIFARSVAAAGLQFVGPSPENIEQFGLKHTARDLATRASVPIVPGTENLVYDADEAATAAKELGFPVMLKSTAGGGGMGLLTCVNEKEVRSSFGVVKSRSEALFHNSGVFLERYYPAAHHIEVQVFGNGQGEIAALGERECSIQRRHQKIIEECPSPFIEQKKPELREKLCSAAVALARSVKYASAGTLEFLVDDKTGDFFFLEMNTRLQVEHGVTEMVYDIDIVELMLRQTDQQLAGNGGLEGIEIEKLGKMCETPRGHAIEARIYAENPAKDYAPSPGLLQAVKFHDLAGTRIDTWIRAGITVSPNYDPLLAKLLRHSSTRRQAVDELTEILSQSAICGPATNLDLLLAILRSECFLAGDTITQFLSTFDFRPTAIDVLSGGAYTLIQDYPGRPTIGRGFGHGGPMDPIAFQIANIIVSNPPGKEGLEITLSGPDLVFLGEALVALTGAPVAATLEGDKMPMWQAVRVLPGQRLTIGKTLSNAGCRAYLAVYGGFLNVADWFGSKATVPMVGVGGYQGRQLRTGDLLRLVDSIPPKVAVENRPLIPASALPKYTEHWDVQVMPGPYAEGFFLDEDTNMFYNATWEVSHNAARGGIRLIGPRPKWAREDGGDGGGHPSNVIEYGYPMGGINWTGDEAVIFPNDCPDFGGFVCSASVVKGDYWKIGQLRSGNTVRFHPISLEDALKTRRANEDFVHTVAKALESGILTHIPEFGSMLIPPRPASQMYAVIKVLEETSCRPLVTYRQGGDDYLLVDYGDGRFDINHKCRTTALNRQMKEGSGSIRFSAGGGGIYNTVCIGNSMMIYYDGLTVHRTTLLEYLISVEDGMGDVRSIIMPNRTFTLPLTFGHPKLTECVERYMANQRPYASYVPDTFKFVADNNGITAEEYRKLWLTAEFVTVGVGFFMALPECLPADPRHRLNAPKMNPSLDSPGGYMMAGMTIPGVDILGYKKGFSKDRPWMFEDMDVITFKEVSLEEYDQQMALFRSGRYEWKVEQTTFDMKAHNELLKSVEGEVAVLKKKQKECQHKMAALEKELLDQWVEEKKGSGISMDSIQALLDGPGVEAIEAPVNANVWKVLLEEGQVVKNGQIAVILEAMKLEINVIVDNRSDGSVVEKILVSPNDIIQSGRPLILLRRNRL
ncbi:Acetyl-CoA/propionyl-CoA carboxylase [Pleurostoma richardsiae]|uniref:Acetyl-CoA/propionyl-CoA carboxylase n=1 Tax=Pleurostoma richardsiae TaxID=41990 RepID=A0AA38VGH7_9PEZI|nr:Acetyl-CoA/propionyl-CoA carboxylase [Pleurostoma richardsiae]